MLRKQISPLAKLLVAEGYVSDEVVVHATALSTVDNRFLGQILIEQNHLTQAQLNECIIKHRKVPHLSLEDYAIGDDMVAYLPEAICREYHLLPVDKLGRILTVAMVDPLDTEALEAVQECCPEARIKPILVNWRAFSAVLNKIFDARKKEENDDTHAMTYESLGLSRVAPSTKAEEVAPKEAPQEPAPSQTEDIFDELDAPLQALAQTDSPLEWVEEMFDRMEIRQTALLEELMTGFVHQLKAVLGNGPASHTDAFDPSVVTAAVRDGLAEALASTRSDEARMHEALEVAESRLGLMRGGLDAPGPLEADGRFAAVSDFAAAAAAPAGSEGDAALCAAIGIAPPLSDFTFDNYVPGEANTFTLSMCKRIAQAPGREYNPLFLYGEVGLGKTHLVNAIGNDIRTRLPGQRVGYVNASRFATRLAEAHRARAEGTFRDHFSHWDVLILDDIQFLGGRVEAQEKLFHVFNAVQQAGRQIIVAADNAPDKLGALEARLISRFASGIVARVIPPEFEARKEILNRLSGALHKRAPDEVLALVALRVPSDVRKLLGAMRKVFAFTDVVTQDITCEKVNEILNHLGFTEAA